MATISGRHVGEIRAVKPDWELSISEDTGVIRIDDKNNLDFWLEIDLKSGEMADIMRFAGMAMKKARKEKHSKE